MTRIALVAALFATVNVAPAAAAYSATRLADGKFDLQFSGLGAAQYVIQATANFTNWTDLGFTQPTNGTLRFVDGVATNLPLRFYRVVSNLDLLTLSGTVRDVYTSAPVTNATVSTTLDSRTAVTDSNGFFFITTTIPATNSSPAYTINVASTDYNPGSLSGTWPVHLQNLDVRLTPPPNNDDFTNRVALFGIATNFTGLNYGASAEAGEPVHLNPGGKSVWWSWTAPPSNGIVVIDTFGSSFDTLLAIYTGTTLAGLTTVTNDNDAGSNLTSRVSFSTVANRVYQIAVDGENSAEGIVQLHLQFYGQPVNDRFANRIVLTNASESVTGNNVVATKEAGEPNHALNFSPGGGKSVWWSWTAPNSGTAVVDTSGSDFDTVVAVYTGTALNNLILVPNGNDDSSGDPPFCGRATISVTKGTTYQIAVDGFSAIDYGNIVLKISQP